MNRLLPFLLLVLLPSGAAGQEIPPGMSPRPTDDCGGEPMMVFWEAERVERLEAIAEETLGPWFHELEPRLRRVAEPMERDLREGALAKYRQCLEGLRRREAICVAAAAGRPELCGALDDPEKRDTCRGVVLAVRVSLSLGTAPCDLVDEPWRRDACVLRSTGLPRCTAGPLSCLLQTWLSPGSCRSPGIFTGAPTPVRFLCRWTLWIEAARGAGDCARGLGRAWREGCQAVAARAPEACPEPGPFEAGLFLDSDCRDEAVAGLLVPTTSWFEGSAWLSMALVNPFPEAARCVLHLEALQGEEVVVRRTTEPFALAGSPRAWQAGVVPLDLRVSPVSKEWSWRVRPECSFALHVLEGVGEAGEGGATTFDW